MGIHPSLGTDQFTKDGHLLVYSAGASTPWFVTPRSLKAWGCCVSSQRGKVFATREALTPRFSEACELRQELFAYNRESYKFDQDGLWHTRAPLRDAGDSIRIL